MTTAKYYCILLFDIHNMECLKISLHFHCMLTKTIDFFLVFLKIFKSFLNMYFRLLGNIEIHIQVLHWFCLFAFDFNLFFLSTNQQAMKSQWFYFSLCFAFALVCVCIRICAALNSLRKHINIVINLPLKGNIAIWIV